MTSSFDKIISVKNHSLKEWKFTECNEHGTIYAISSDFGDRMTKQSMGRMVLLREHF